MVLAIPFVLRTPDDAYTHDYRDHVSYTQYLQEHKNLPYPGQGVAGGEAHQPPLYYLLIYPLGAGTPHHVLYVRLFSVLLGALALFLIHDALVIFDIKTAVRLISLIFLAT